MTKAEIVDTIRNIVGWQHDRRQVANVVNFIYSQYIHDMIDSRAKEYDFLVKEYTDQTVTHDTNEDIYYISLPASIVGLPTKTEGVIEINNVDGVDMNYFPMTINDRQYMDGLDADTVNTYTGFYVVGNKIKLYNHTTTITKVRLALAINFSDFAETDEVHLPGGKDYDIVQLTINMINQKAPINLKNNNNVAES